MNNNQYKKNVLVLTSTFPFSTRDSQPSFVRGLCDELSQFYELTVLAPSVTGCTQDKSEAYEVRRFNYAPVRFQTLAGGQGILNNLRRSRANYLLLPFFFLAMFVSAVRIVREKQIEIVHAHWIVPQGLIGILLKMLFPTTKLVVTSHGGDLFALNGALLRNLKKWVLAKADSITVVSTAMKTFCEKEFGLDGGRIHVCSMGVDTDRQFYPKDSVDENKIIFVGRLVPKKGVDVLIDAFGLIGPEWPEVQLHIIGGGEELEYYKRLALGSGNGGNFHFHGALPPEQVAEQLRGSSVAIFPFRVDSNGDQEGLGLTMVEAMASGCATIASDLPAVADVVFHGKTGLIVPSENSEALADAIRLLLTDSCLRKQLRKAGRDSVVSTFSWPVVAERYSAVFERCTGSEG